MSLVVGVYVEGCRDVKIWVADVRVVVRSL